MPLDVSEDGEAANTEIGLLLGLTGLLCIAEIWIAGLNYANHQIWYGAHGWFPGELAFLLHYLLFGIPAIVLAEGWPAWMDAGYPVKEGPRP